MELKVIIMSGVFFYALPAVCADNVFDYLYTDKLYFTNPYYEWPLLRGVCPDAGYDCAVTVTHPANGPSTGWAAAYCTFNGQSFNPGSNLAYDGRYYSLRWLDDVNGGWNGTLMSHSRNHQLFLINSLGDRPLGLPVVLKCQLMFHQYDGRVTVTNYSVDIVSANVFSASLTTPAPITSSKYETIAFSTTLTTTYPMGNEIMSYTMSGPCSAWDPHLELPDTTIHRPSDGAFPVPASGSNIKMKFTPQTAGAYSCVANFTFYGP
ncbi:TPA: hypothetical protein QHX44_002209 [Klebsiella oxytoca]|nr:hypothetical protein [Klebsiella oxytoca]